MVAIAGLAPVSSHDCFRGGVGPSPPFWSPASAPIRSRIRSGRLDLRCSKPGWSPDFSCSLVAILPINLLNKFYLRREGDWEGSCSAKSELLLAAGPKIHSSEQSIWLNTVSHKPELFVIS